MKAYVIYYQIEGKKWNNNFRVDAKNRESAIRKMKRKIAKDWRISEDEIIIKSVGVIGYY
jgi:DNA-binding response OmpR family regulator